MARISTHVLDIAKGTPVAGIPIELYFDEKLLRNDVTNSDGRTDQPLLSDERIDIGEYEIVFDVVDYLRSQHPASPPFYDRIRIRFSVGEDHGDYHIPLLLAPHGYSTYRGS